jgi:transposase
MASQPSHCISGGIRNLSPHRFCLIIRDWLTRFAGRTDVEFSVEACTGWRFIVEELQRVGITPHLAETAETAAARGPERRAKTDRTDSATQRQLVVEGRLPEAWIPPEHVLEIRAKLELYKDLRDEHTAWVQRVHATLFHQGAQAVPDLDRPATRARLAQTEELSPAGRQAVATALRNMEFLQGELDQLYRELSRYARAQAGCRALQTQYGVGPFTATAIWAMLGDTRRFSASRKAVRHTGLEVTAYSSDGKRSRGHLSRQGSPLLRWALYEAGYCAAKKTSPDRPYFTQVMQRIDGNRAALSMARKIARRSHHILRELGDEAYAPPRPLTTGPLPACPSAVATPHA